MLFHFENCFPFGIMYAHQRLLQGLARRAAQGEYRRGLQAHETVPPVGNELTATPLFVLPARWQP